VRRSYVGFIFQAYNLVPTLDVRDNILLGATSGQSLDRLDELASELGLDTMLHKFPTELSGGQQQRAAIARALVKRPAVLFCDEPTGALDTSNGMAVLNLLSRYRDVHGTAIVLVTHNPQIAELADRVLTMKDGVIVSEARNESPVAVDEIAWV
jgi:putative ABC transport system ATP-binding protein